MKVERKNVWAALDDEHLHRVAFVDGRFVITVCSLVGETRATYHVDDRAGSNATPAVYRERHCSICTDARPSLCVCGFRTSSPPDSSAFHAAHREHHTLAYPALDARTIANLDRMVQIHLERELAQLAGVLQPPVGIAS